MKRASMVVAKSVFFLMLVFLFLAITSFKLLDHNSEPVTWALLIAGGQGVGAGYASQVDVAEGFSLLRDGGISPKHIITFMYDDVAYHQENPFPGKLKSSLDGPDLYETLQKDYTGLDVNADILLAVLNGDSVAVNGRKVIRATPRDRIFLYFAGHGVETYLELPNNDIWRKRSIMDALWGMHSKGKFKSMVFYVMACHSACVFEDHTFPDQVYMVGAAECDQQAASDLCYYGTCCASLFGKSWIKDSRRHNRKTRSVGRQFRQMKRDLTRSCDASREGRMCSIVECGDKKVKQHMLNVYLGHEPGSQFA